MKRVLTSSAALLWGLQFAFLNPVLALLLVALFDATPADVGWVLAVYNAGGFIASLVIPAWADRSGDYLRPLLVCAVLTLALAGVLTVATTLPIAVIALIVLGGPAGVGVSLLFADLKHSGAARRDVMNTRAVVSFAWVAGPPLAALIMGALGSRAILPVLAGVAALNVVTTVALIARRRSGRSVARPSTTTDPESQPIRRASVFAIVTGFVLLQATNSAAVAVMGLFVTHRLGVPVLWSGVALGVSALLEIPALWVLGRISVRYSSQALIVSGCVAGVLYYSAMAFVTDPLTLIALQVLNAWFFGVVTGIGLTMFQQIIPRPGLATGLFMNTRRVGAILSGPIIALASLGALGYPAVFGACAVLTLVALVIVEATRRVARRDAASAPTASELALTAA